MANRTYLIQTSTPVPVRYNPSSADVLADAKNCIPIYWYSLFDGSSIVQNSIEAGDGQTMIYPCFVMSTADARTRSQHRKKILQRITPDSHASVLAGWFRLLDGIQLPYVHLDTAEFCMIDESFNEHLVTSLLAFDSLEPSAPFSTSPAWREMLDVAQIDPDDFSGTVAAHKLAGFPR